MKATPRSIEKQFYWYDMLCASSITLETKVKFMQFLSYWCKATWQWVSKQKSVSCHVSSACIFFSKIRRPLCGIPLIRQIMQFCSVGVCLSFLVPAPLIFFFSDIDECNAANNSCHENAWCNNTQGSFNCFCKPGYDGDGHNCTGKIICMRLVYESTFKF